MNNESPIKKRLKEARLEAGLSQKDLGIAAGIDEFVASARMNQYETGKHVPSFKVVQQIAHALKIPTAYFYAEEDELAQMIKIYGKLTKKQQRQLQIFLVQLVD